jgi:hypothetical protein
MRVEALRPEAPVERLNEGVVGRFSSNDVWAMDFIQLATGQKIRVLTVVDTFSRFSPALDPRFNYRAEDVVATLGTRRRDPRRRLRDNGLSENDPSSGDRVRQPGSPISGPT